ncbi:hypothetical protein ABH926_005225 [Catenulispora sp. GP43]|uniref:hypothetical protein n=1 Tax=Catenulispora sp. GP43 TaxID=3156263 RepID=UPI003517E252
MAGFKRLLDDLREGKDFDVYLTIGLAAVVSALSLFDVISTAKISSLLLAVLAVMAYNILATRAAVDRAGAATKRGPELLDDFPAELSARREASDEVYLIGISMSRTIESSYAAFERTLRRGGHIRVLMVNVDADEASITTQGQASKPSTEDIRHDIRQTLGKLRSLAATAMAANNPGGLEVRTTRFALKFGLNYLDVGTPSAALYVQLYSFRLPGESRPMFHLTMADGEWFECYRYQAEALWEEGTTQVLAPVQAVGGAAS